MEHPEDSGNDDYKAASTIDDVYDLNDEERNDASEEVDLLGLMLPTFSGTKDDFGKEVVPPCPLLFDRVSEGREFVSKSNLLRFPLEVLALVIEKVPVASLPSLALVNTDCRQLARSRQFPSLRFDYSDTTLAIVQKLQEEAAERSNHHGLTQKPALGPCIRRLIVATHPGWLNYRHDIELSQSYNALSEIEKSNRLTVAGRAFGSYISSIQSLLRNRIVMPHLELLHWEDKILLQPSFYDALADSNVQHLKLNRVPVSKAFAVNPPRSQSSGSWPLRSLHLEIIPDMRNHDIDVSLLCTSILHVCAPSLQSLTWASCYPRFFHTDGIKPSPCFPSLRHLRLQFLKLADDCLLRMLVHDELNSLDVDTQGSSACSQFFDRRGWIPALKILVWHSAHLPESQSLTFLRANPQIAKLSIPLAASPTLLGDKLLPLLTEAFTNLTSLSLVWEEREIPSQAIERISRITTLEQLHLSAGDQYGWRHDWLIDHDIMRKYIPNLPMLEKLAFSRDSYSNGFTTDCERYYVDGWRSFQDALNANHTKEIFEKDHREWILHEVDSYVAEMSQLKWLYFGQIPMTVEHCGEKKRNFAKPLTTQRDECWTLLQNMFR